MLTCHPKLPGAEKKRRTRRSVSEGRARRCCRPSPTAPPWRSADDLLAVLSDVQAFALLLFRDAQADEHVDKLEDDEGRDRIVSRDRAYGDQLGEDLPAVALEHACRAA